MAEVVYVDDDPLAREVVREALEGGGHVVRLAESGTEMMRHLLERPAQVVILDVHMPEMTGDRLARILRKSLDPPLPRIVLFSALAVAELRRIGRKVGATGFCRKGASPKALLDTVAAAAHFYETEKDWDRLPVTPETPVLREVPEPIEE